MKKIIIFLCWCLTFTSCTQQISNEKSNEKKEKYLTNVEQVSNIPQDWARVLFHEQDLFVMDNGSIYEHPEFKNWQNIPESKIRFVNISDFINAHKEAEKVMPKYRIFFNNEKIRSVFSGNFTGEQELFVRTIKDTYAYKYNDNIIFVEMRIVTEYGEDRHYMAITPPKIWQKK